MSKLTNLLEDMIALARAHAGTPMRRHLHGGLTVEIKAVSNEIRLTISREDKYPSLDVWDFFMKHFPYPVQANYPVPDHQDGRYTL